MTDHNQNFLADLNVATQRAERELTGNPATVGDAPASEASEADPEWAAEMRVKGVPYSVPIEQAKDLGWRMIAPTPGDGNDKFSHAAAVYGNTHEHLVVAELGGAFGEVPVQEYHKLTMQRVLAKTNNSAADFVAAWDDMKWYESAAHVSHIAEEMSAIEEEEGWPVGNLPAQRTKRQACKFVAFVFNLQRSSGKAFQEASWIGSPAVPEQLLATAQRMLSTKEGLEWECPIPTPWIEVSEEIFVAGEKLQLIGESAQMSFANESSKLASVKETLRSAKSKARRARLGA